MASTADASAGDAVAEGVAVDGRANAEPRAEVEGEAVVGALSKLSA